MTSRPQWGVRLSAPWPAVGLFLTASVLSGLAPGARGCLPGLQDYDVCFNIFLERDFPLVEAFLRNRAFGSRGRVLVEPGDLATMCDGFGELLECYAFHYLNCGDLGGVRREYFERLIKAMVSSFQLLCGKDRTMLQNLFYDGHCIGAVSDGAGDCRTANFDLGTAWKRVFRFRATQRDCSDLVRHTRCLVRALSSSRCRPEATTAYNTTAIDFLFVFCQQDFSAHRPTSLGEHLLPSAVTHVIALLVSTLTVHRHWGLRL